MPFHRSNGPDGARERTALLGRDRALHAHALRRKEAVALAAAADLDLLGHPEPDGVRPNGLRLGVARRDPMRVGRHGVSAVVLGEELASAQATLNVTLQRDSCPSLLPFTSSWGAVVAVQGGSGASRSARRRRGAAVPPLRRTRAVDDVIRSGAKNLFGAKRTTPRFERVRPRRTREAHERESLPC